MKDSRDLRNSIQRRIKRAVRESEIDVASGPFVVAVSGGPDSLTLLHALRAARPDVALHIAHMDHGLRGGKGVSDARFVRDIAEKWELPITVQRVNVREYRASHPKLSVEAAAREVRYKFLSSVAHQEGAAAVVVGHTADDQAETILLHLIRGAGLSGLQGMLGVSSLLSCGYTTTLLRPLLGVWHRETEDYCSRVGLRPRVDLSNKSLRFTRNRIRLQLLPHLEQFNPAIKKALIRFAGTVTRDNEFLNGLVSGHWSKVATHVEGGVSLEQLTLREMPIALQARLVRYAYAYVNGSLQGLGQAPVDAALKMIGDSGTHRIDLPGGLALSVGYGKIYLGSSDSEPSPYPQLRAVTSLTIPGETIFSGWRVVARWSTDKLYSSLTNRSPAAIFDAAVANSGLWVRPWEPGDRISLGNGVGTKKLQDLFVDSKIPRSWRHGIPVVTTLEGVIIWVVGLWVVPRAPGGGEESPVIFVEFHNMK